MTTEADALRILEGLPDAVIALDDESRVSWMNPAAETLTGVPRSKGVGAPYSEVVRLVDPADGTEVAPPIGLRMPLGRGLPEREYELARVSGGRIPVAVRCSYAKDDDHVVTGAICSLRDLRARHGMDLRAVDLISTVSHEIRSPLTSVKGFTKTLLDRWDRFDDDMKKEMLQQVNADADRIVRLLGELLDISRLEAGKLRLRPILVDVHELAQKVAGKLQPQTDRHTITVDFDPGTPTVLADPDKLQQVLTNLVENAIKYTEGGSIRVSGTADAHRVVVSVIDEGDGIPAAEISTLFRKFVTRTRAGSPSGTGLGLYIARGLMEAHGGELNARSAPGTGSTFTFWIPRIREVV